jgi:hypothetical protein
MGAGMELIYTRDNLQVYADTATMGACIVRGDNRILLDLEPLVPLSPLEAKNLRLLGQNPGDYLHIGHSYHILPREAAPAWEEALSCAQQQHRDLDTSMIPLFRQNLPGLAEVREAEDLIDSMVSNVTVYMDINESVVSSKAAEISRRFPRETLYVKAEQLAMSTDEQRALTARKILAALICGKELPADALRLLAEQDAIGRNRPSRLPVTAP